MPKEIVEHLRLGDGDRIRWILFRDGKVLVAVAGPSPARPVRGRRRR